MAGKIRRLVDELIAMRSKGSPALAHFVRVNLLLRGVDPDAYGDSSEDDEAKVAIVERMIREFKGH